jgi:Kef-type K+ transport system membrane component KefB
MRNVVAYILILITFGFAIWSTLNAGRKLHLAENPRQVAQAEVERNDITKTFHDNLRGPLGILLTQIVVIVFLAQILSRLALRVGQPQVIGEVIAGILLGPSFLGFVSPQTMRFLFPESSVATLQMFSQVGVMLFMFLVGTDIDIQHLLKQGHTALLVSHASIIVPFLLGTTVSLFIYPAMAPPLVPFVAFALFMGVAMSITAFPVLARIIEERGLTRSNLGVVALGCAAVDDVSAWCILAAVVGVVKAQALGQAALTILFLLVFVAAMVLVLRPILRNLLLYAGRRQRSFNSPQYAAWGAQILVFALAAGLATEIIGVHALFGAFLAGAILPSTDFRSFCKERLESVSSGLLLPLFFAFTGLRTQINLLNNSTAWFICIAVIVAAIAGKLGASTLAARLSGMKWNDSFALGALMNTRGLMELIVLNIGYDLGILSSQIFAILVLMALTTTLMTAPLLSLVRR